MKKKQKAWETGGDGQRPWAQLRAADTEGRVCGKGQAESERMDEPWLMRAMEDDASRSPVCPLSATAAACSPPGGDP